MKKKINHTHPEIQDDDTEPEFEFANLDYIKKLEIQNLILSKILSTKKNSSIMKDINNTNKD
jgi:hypothetical protein